MTQARSPGVGSQYIVDATQVPTDRTFETVARKSNRVTDLTENIRIAVAANTTVTRDIIAEDNGIIEAFKVAQDSVAANATVGGRIKVLNASNSNAEIVDYGIGGGTNSNLADAQTVNIAAYTPLKLMNPKTEAASTRFNKGDQLTFTFTPDGSTWTGDIQLQFKYQTQGRT